MEESIAGLNGNKLRWTTVNTPSVTVPSKGFAEVIMNVPAVKGYYLISVSLIGATRIDYLAQVVVAGCSRVFDEETTLYLKLYNNHTSPITSVYQLSIWFADPN